MDETISRSKVLAFIEDMEKRVNGKDLITDTVMATTKCVKDFLTHMPLAQSEPQWIPVTKKAHPDTPIRVQIQMDNGWIITAYYQEGEWLSVPDCGEPLRDEWVEAWRELPEPYTERRKE